MNAGIYLARIFYPSYLSRSFLTGVGERSSQSSTKASTTQLLVEVMSDVTSALEDNRAGVVLSAIDFSKAFNRLDHTQCLLTFMRRGASEQILGLLSAFLTNRTMSVRVEGSASLPRTVNAGAPQGSGLGCYLFNIGVDNLEEGLNHNDEIQTEAFEETHRRN